MWIQLNFHAQEVNEVYWYYAYTDKCCSPCTFCRSVFRELNIFIHVSCFVLYNSLVSKGNISANRYTFLKIAPIGLWEYFYPLSPGAHPQNMGNMGFGGCLWRHIRNLKFRKWHNKQPQTPCCPYFGGLFWSTTPRGQLARVSEKCSDLQIFTE